MKMEMLKIGNLKSEVIDLIYWPLTKPSLSWDFDFLAHNIALKVTK